MILSWPISALLRVPTVILYCTLLGSSSSLEVFGLFFLSLIPEDFFIILRETKKFVWAETMRKEKSAADVFLIWFFSQLLISTQKIDF